MWGSVFVSCFIVHCYVSFLVLGKRELVALLCLSSWCLVAFLMVPWVGLQSVFVVFSYHTHLLFSYLSILLRFSKRVGYGLSCNS